MLKKIIFTSLTRIADFTLEDIKLEAVDRKEWKNGDYVCCRVTDPGDRRIRIEIQDGRMMQIMEDDLLIGVLGERYATLELTGTWSKVGRKGKMEILTGAGLFGKMTSKSYIMPEISKLQYEGHVTVNGKTCNMDDYVPETKDIPFKTPVVLLVGTSMSAGKTTSARIVCRQLKACGLKVAAAKFTGAGRYRDILSVKDAGADIIVDFVDAGLPSTICPAERYVKAHRFMLNTMAAARPDVAVIEVGASPLERYNSDLAIRAIKDNIRCSILCATDPYSVLGIMKSFDMTPDLVSGAASNTLAGREMVKKLTGVTALNIIEPGVLPMLRKVLKEKLDLKSMKSKVKPKKTIVLEA